MRFQELQALITAILLSGAPQDDDATVKRMVSVAEDILEECGVHAEDEGE